MYPQTYISIIKLQTYYALQESIYLCVYGNWSVEGEITNDTLLNVKSNISVLGIVHCCVGDTGGSPVAPLNQVGQYFQCFTYSYLIS